MAITLSLEEAVRKMTSLPASRAGLVDRGTVRPGFVADLVIFDPETVIDRSTYIDPWQLSAGISHVLVAGETAYSEGVSTGVSVGQIL